MVIPVFSSSLPLPSSSSTSATHITACRRRPRSLSKWLAYIRPRTAESALTATTTTCSMISLAATLHDAHRHLVEELAFAHESQESIYYSGDWAAAKEAMDTCWAHHQKLLAIPNYCHLIPNHWPDTLARLQAELDALPLPAAT